VRQLRSSDDLVYTRAVALACGEEAGSLLLVLALRRLFWSARSWLRWIVYPGGFIGWRKVARARLSRIGNPGDSRVGGLHSAFHLQDPEDDFYYEHDDADLECAVEPLELGVVSCPVRLVILGELPLERVQVETLFPSLCHE
jgi:hypothetical protein